MILYKKYLAICKIIHQFHFLLYCIEKGQLLLHIMKMANFSQKMADMSVCYFWLGCIQ